MMDRLRALEPQAYALLRIVSGFLWFFHGSQKVFGGPGNPPGEAPLFIKWTAGPIEVVGGAFLVIGFLTRPTAFICSGTMAVAYWLAHGTKALLPIQNGGELSVIYCFVFLYIAARGAGIWSVDGDD